MGNHDSPAHEPRKQATCWWLVFLLVHVEPFLCNPFAERRIRASSCCMRSFAPEWANGDKPRVEIASIDTLGPRIDFARRPEWAAGEARWRREIFRLSLQDKSSVTTRPRAALEASLPWACTHPPTPGRKTRQAIGLIDLPRLDSPHDSTVSQLVSRLFNSQRDGACPVGQAARH